MTQQEITLREFLEQAIEGKLGVIEERFKAQETALKLQAVDNKEHFERLNGEAARILKATEITVSRDTWDAFKKSDQDWKNVTDRTMQGLLTKGEFQIYKESTDKALLLKAGQSIGVGTSFGVLAQALTVLMAFIAILLATYGAFHSAG